MEMEKQVMPKWFNGVVYESGDVVSNPFTGETAELTAEELSMYDLIMGAQVCEKWTIVQKGLTWFRRENPSAYMTLLD
jgi:hypothetical protein|tara:strand:- start:1090 stop:1323 length:234 start_codon:yes stop_codon:yes gene_type:complete